MGCHKQLSSSPTPSCGEPINLLSGNTWVTQHDYALPAWAEASASIAPGTASGPPLACRSFRFPECRRQLRSTYEERLVLLNNFAVTIV